MKAFISEVHEAVVYVVEGVLLVGEAQVALLVKPDLGRREVLHHHPLPDVELAPLDHQWVLYVLLHHELRWHSQAVVSYVVKVVETANPPSTRHDCVLQQVQFGLAIHTLRIPFISHCGSRSPRPLIIPRIF